jgi:hypothetical protein
MELVIGQESLKYTLIFMNFTVKALFNSYNSQIDISYIIQFI